MGGHPDLGDFYTNSTLIFLKIQSNKRGLIVYTCLPYVKINQIQGLFYNKDPGGLAHMSQHGGLTYAELMA